MEMLRPYKHFENVGRVCVSMPLQHAGLCTKQLVLILSHGVRVNDTEVTECVCFTHTYKCKSYKLRAQISNLFDLYSSSLHLSLKDAFLESLFMSGRCFACRA